MTHTFKLADDTRLENCIRYLRSLGTKGHVIRIMKPGKTPAQRNYWHNLLEIIAKDQGEDEKDLKERLKYEFLPLHEVRTARGSYMAPPHTEDLTKEQYSLLIEKTVILAGFLNIVLPDAHYYGMENDTNKRA